MRNVWTSTPSAHSQIVWPADSWNPLTTFAAILGAAFCFIVPSVAYILFAVAAGRLDPYHVMAAPTQLLVAQAVSYVPTAAFVVAVVPALAKQPLSALGMRVPSAREVGTALAGVVVMVVLTSLASVAMAKITGRHDTEAAVALLRQLHTLGERALFVAIAIVLAPVVEELLFRFFLFNAISKWAPVWVAALVSSALFGAAHSQSAIELLTVGVPLAFGGLVLASVYALTRNYWCNVLTHATFNAIGVGAVLVFHAK